MHVGDKQSTFPLRLAPLLFPGSRSPFGSWSPIRMSSQLCGQSSPATFRSLCAVARARRRPFRHSLLAIPVAHASGQCFGEATHPNYRLKLTAGKGQRITASSCVFRRTRRSLTWRWADFS